MDKPRVVLLGASNVARGFAPALAAAGRVNPGRILVAGGRGRAYSRASVLVCRGLPSIRGCGLWRELERSGDGALYALLTDLGNDLVYGASVDETLAAVAEVAERLRSAGARLVISALPLDSLDRFPTAWLDAVRRSFFPGSTLGAEVLLGRAHQLDAGVRRLGDEVGATLVEQDGDWYGLDPIHHRYSRQHDAFKTFTAPWGGEARRATWALRGQTLRAWPERSDFFGRSLRRRQPCARLPGDAALHLY
ncbi:MAG: hypothetical protein AAFY88_04630 [Acidobacteriota bacterium]